MGELEALLRAIGRPQVGHHRVRRFGPIRQALRRTVPYLLMFAATYLAFSLASVREPGRMLRIVDAALSTRGLVLLFAAIFAVVFWRRRALRRLTVANNEGAILCAGGRRDEAVALFESLARRGRRHLPYHALFVGNLGVAKVIRGELAEGKALLGEALRSRWLTRANPSAAGGAFAAWLSRTYALENDLRVARSWREVASALLPPRRRGALLIADATILLRAGHAGAAADAISAGWMGAEGELPGHERRALRALHAFALAQAGRDAETASALAGLWPPIPNQLDYLGASWPELRGFLAAWKLAQAA